MKLYYLIFTSLVFVIFACKKKENNVSQTPSNNPVTVVGGDLGTFSSIYNTKITQFGITNDSSINATFYDTPYQNKTYIYAGTVTVNNSPLYYSTPNFYYATNNINIKSLNWQVSGSGTIAASSFSYVPNYPVYSGTPLLVMDSVSKSSGFNMVVSGISNTNFATYVFISQGSAIITKSVSTYPSTLTIAASELTSFLSNYNISVSVNMSNYSNIILNNHQYGINAQRTFSKNTHLKP